MIHTLNKRKTLTVTKRTTPAQGLAQQKSDFTAEGAPPPERAASAVPGNAEATHPQPADTRTAGHGS